jgi:hypothetical protein
MTELYQRIIFKYPLKPKENQVPKLAVPKRNLYMKKKTNMVKMFLKMMTKMMMKKMKKTTMKSSVLDKKIRELLHDLLGFPVRKNVDLNKMANVSLLESSGKK